MIIPNISGRFAILQWTYRFLPMIDIVQTLSMQHTTARETNKLRFEFCDFLCQILAKSVTFISIMRFQTHEINTHLSLSLWNKGQADAFTLFEISLIFISNDQLRLIFRPLIANNLHLSLRYNIPRFINQSYHELLILSIQATSIQTHVIIRSSMLSFLLRITSTSQDRNAIPSYIINRCSTQHRIVRIIFAHSVFYGNRRQVHSLPSSRCIPRMLSIILVVFKITVLKKFGTQSAISSPTDIFKENTNQLI